MKCLRCGSVAEDDLCFSCINVRKVCDKCGAQGVKTLLFEGKHTCKACYRSRYIPEDKICPGCGKTPKNWNKSFGMCRPCALDRKAELLPGDDVCPSCSRKVLASNEWRLQRGPRLDMTRLICTHCYLGRAPKQTLRHRTQAEYRRERRLRLLPKDMRCPICRTLKLKLRSWVITDTTIACRSCSLKGNTAMITKPKATKPKRITKEEREVKRLEELSLIAVDEGKILHLPEGYLKCVKCGRIHTERMACTCGIT